MEMSACILPIKNGWTDNKPYIKWIYNSFKPKIRSYPYGKILNSHY